MSKLPNVLRLTGAIAASAVAFAVTTVAAPSGQMRQVRNSAEAFYAAYRRVKPGGVPEGKDLAIFRSVVSGRLYRLLQGANEAEAAYARNNPNSPPMVEGDLFTSLFEGASRHEVEECQASGRTAACRVRLTNVDARSGEAFSWRDQIFLVQGAHGWRVDDIEFGGTWEFMHKGRLGELLESVIRDSRRP